MENSLCCNNSCSGWKQAIWAWQCQQREIHGLIYLSKDFPRESLRAYWFLSGFFLSSMPSARESVSTERPAWSLFLCLLQRNPPYARPSPLKGSRGKRRSKFANTKRQEDVSILTCFFCKEGPSTCLFWYWVLRALSGCCFSDFSELLGTIYCTSHEPWLLQITFSGWPDNQISHV